MYVNNLPVGYIGIRTEIDDNWKKWCGNIYYAIRLSERKKGYAKASLLALCNYLDKENTKILYECRSENTPSVNTVTGAGGKEICRYIRFIGRK